MFLLRNSRPLWNKITKDLLKNKYLNTNENNVFNFEVRRWKTNYKAAVLKEFKKPLSVELLEATKELKKGEIRIGVYFCSLNSADIELFQGSPLFNIPLPIVPGYEFAGEVLETGELSEKKFKHGDRVVALTGHLNARGGLATQCIVDENDCFPLNNVSLKDASILLHGHGTALLAFTKYCELDENDTIIITAGPAGLGLAAIELASNVFKAKVIAICDNEDSSDLVREKGASKAFSLAKGYKNVYKNLQETFANSKAIVAYDAVGNGLLHILANFVDPVKGKLLSVDPFYDATIFRNQKPKFELPKKQRKSKDDEIDAVDPSRVQHIDLYNYRYKDLNLYRDIITETLSLYEEELISAHISQMFKLNDIDDAIEFINKKKCTGKVLIDITEDIKNEQEKSD